MRVTGSDPVSIDRRNPEQLHATPGYHHVTIADNTLAALAAAGAEPDDVVRTVIYVVSDSQTVLADVWSRFNASVIASAFTTASTLLGVTQLGFPGQRVELDVTAIRGEGN